MLKSMTGYGESAQEADRFVLSIEVKSVNHRFLKISLKAPEEIPWAQAPLEERIRERLDRGALFATVRFDAKDPSELYQVDEKVLEKYLSAIERLGGSAGRAEPPRLVELLSLPGVIRSEEALLLGKEEVLPVACQVMDAALDSLLAMREAEGANLEADLRQRRERLEEILGGIRQISPRAVEEHHRKLEQRVHRLLADKEINLAPEDLAREVAIIAERSDIAEEIARMQSHLAQFADALESRQPVGRKLEFLVQEMLRESNTMGAKAVSAELGVAVVELRAEVDRMKEQVLNIE